MNHPRSRSLHRRHLPAFVLLMVFSLPGIALRGATGPQDGPITERQYLSGHGPADAVPWEFTVTGGRRANEATTIPVPSHWEQHGFGTYNYGQEPCKGDERGLYRTRFAVPAAWRGRRIRLVFDGAMTDTAVKINGRSAGPLHQGGFYRFSYDVTSLVKPGAAGAEPENLLEVEVSKVSANPDTERAERGGDYWVFGGIYRPVYLESVPAQSIARIAIDARADGTLAADVALGYVSTGDRIEAQVFTTDGRPAGARFATAIPGGGAGAVHLATQVDQPELWTAETPRLYSLRISLHRGDEALHTVTQRFGFRTFEVRAGAGLFLNGQRILLKGVNRHSFRPETGRALTRDDCYVDVRLIKAMNMNAVRMSHYPPDVDFLEACDELGLYVLDELSGWQHAHDTAVGRLLVRELVERDVNHPSILFWDNGNEGGFNRDLDGEFALYDPQRRRVLHPWDPFSGIDTKHYLPFDDLLRRLRGPNLVMPTEFLHGLYDGGMGAGLADYWKAIATSPNGAGGFLWVLADEGIARTDQGGRTDVFSTFAPDGIVGPHHEREGSFYTVRDLWCPVQVDPPKLDAAFTGTVTVHNAFDFTSLAACHFSWRLLRFGEKEAATLASGTVPGPAVAPHATGALSLTLPVNWRDADAVALTATDPSGAELWTWTWPTPKLAERAAFSPTAAGAARATAETAGGAIALRAGDVTAEFDAATGLLRAFRRGEKISPLSRGPRLTFARPVSAAPVAWLAFAEADATALTRRLATPQPANTLELSLVFDRDQPWIAAKLELSADGATWRTVYDSSRRPGDGLKFDFPPQTVVAVRLSGLRTADGRAVALKSMRLGHAAGRFPAPGGSGTVTSGTGLDESTKQATAWVESRGAAGLDSMRWTLFADGTLQLAYRYTLDGEFLYHGITFDHPEDQMNGLKWLGEGPFRVWQNRTRGTWLGLHETVRHDQQPGGAWVYPEFEGYFAGVRRARLGTAAGPLTISGMPDGTFLRVGTPRISHPQTMAEFPSGNLSILHAIPAMGSKFKPAEVAGPSGLPARANGTYSGTLRFRLGDDP